MSGALLLLVAVLYLGLLFGIAWWGDRNTWSSRRALPRAWVYSLALGVYCTSWTFYGAVGNATSAGWAYLPIYLGPIIVYVFGFPVLRRMVEAAKAQKITSIADFLASRFGRSQSLAALVTLVALVAAIPYIALQFKAVALSVNVLTETATAGSGPWFTDTAFFSAIILSVFAILFGTRVLDATEHHRGLMLAIAVESLVKLIAFAAVGIYAFVVLQRGDASSALTTVATVPLRATQLLTPDFLVSTLLSMAAIVCLPRQFQVGVVECEEPRDLRRARWIFPLYLGLFTLFVLPIASLGIQRAPSTIDPDSYVLWLPLSQGQDALALLTFIGGFSAATGMVIVASVALATMVSNELVVPMLSRVRRLRLTDKPNFASWVLWIRRTTILLLCAMAFAYYRASASRGNLASLGLLAFVAVSQFAPGILFGLYSRRVSARGVRLGLLAGFLVWIYTLLLPTLAGSGWLPDDWLKSGPLQIAWLRPHALFGLDGLSAITHGAIWSLGINLLIVAAQRTLRPAAAHERLHARVFMGAPATSAPLGETGLPPRALVGDLLALGTRILGEANLNRLISSYESDLRRPLKPDHVADGALVRFVERELAAALGATSSRLVLTGALRSTGMEIDEVAALLDESSQERRFNQRILHTTLENLGQGVSVVDSDLRLVAWNQRYVELFDYPEALIHVGCPVADLIRYNAERGEWGAVDAEAQVNKRLQHLREGSSYVFQRQRGDGRMLEMRGQPLPGGGFVTTYSDITEFKDTERALLEAKDHLEQRVAERTEALEVALQAQKVAQRAAEAANQSKTRFIAAASHDLLQPLHAARLFMSSLQEQGQLSPEARALSERVDSGMRAAEDLLDGLLDISRLDSGVLSAEIMPMALGPLLEALRAQFAPLATARGLQFRVVGTRIGVVSNRRLLRRILQNMLANAIRYTARGSVLLGVRRRGSKLEIQVLDTGPGIAERHRELIFEEFQRIEVPSGDGRAGLGLGLSICDRMARLLEHPLRLQSVLGRGSVFSVQVPACESPMVSASALQPLAALQDSAPTGSQGQAAHVLCIDNEPSILEGMGSLLKGWGLSTDLAISVEAAEFAFATRRPDLIIADYHLQSDRNGLDALALLCQDGIPGALVTADSAQSLTETAKERGFIVLRKPVRPAALRALISQLVGRGR